MHTRRLFNVFLVGLLVPFVGCDNDNVPRPKTKREAEMWDAFYHRYETAFNGGASGAQDAIGLFHLERIKEINPNAVCEFGDYPGQHVDALIKIFKGKVAERERTRRYR